MIMLRDKLLLILNICYYHAKRYFIMRYLKNYDYAQICYVTRYQTFVMIKLKDTPLKDTSGFAPSR